MSEKIKSSLAHPALYLVAGLLFVGAIFWYNNASFAESQRKIYATLADQYETVAFVGKELTSARTPEQFTSLFSECEEQNEFDALLGQDSKYMDEPTLTRALELHRLCSGTFKNRRVTSSELLQTSLETMKDTIALVENNRVKLNATKVADAWLAVKKLEDEQTKLHARNIQLQKEYWEIERDKVTNTISFAEREEAFGTRNTEARANNARMQELNAKIRDAREKAESAWSDFREHYLYLAE